MEGYRLLEVLVLKYKFLNRGRAVEFRFSAWSSIAQSVCEWVFSLLATRCLRLPRFESCIQQKKTTCLLSIRISLACARSSKLTTTHKYPNRAWPNGLRKTKSSYSTWFSKWWLSPMISNQMPFPCYYLTTGKPESNLVSERVFTSP